MATPTDEIYTFIINGVFGFSAKTLNSLYSKIETKYSFSGTGLKDFRTYASISRSFRGLDFSKETFVCTLSNQKVSIDIIKTKLIQL